MNHEEWRKKSEGMTLVEVLIALAMFVLILGAVTAFEANVFSYRRTISDSLETAQDAQVILRTMLKEMRGIAPSENGAYPIVNAATNTVSFFDDANGDGTMELITYTLASTTLYRAVIQPAGMPPVYNPGSQSTTTLAVNVRNSSTTPVFQYYDTNYTGTSSPLSLPIVLTSVRLIRINLTLDINPTKSPQPITYTTQAELRNLKSNL